MAKKIPLEILGKVVTESVKTETALEYKATAFEMFGEIIKNTPVDTGRARGNWNITTDTPDYGTTTSATVTEPALRDLDEFPTIFIANGLDYVVDLENGRSGQAPAGIINPAIAAARAKRGR